MSRFPASPSSESYAIFPPAGDQAGFSSVPRSPVSCSRPLPSLLIAQMSFEPPRVLVNAIDLPSGDHVGSPLNAVASVSRFGCVPSAFITKTSMPLGLFRFDSKAICEPSGDHAPSWSTPTENVSSLDELPSALTVQRSRSPLRAVSKRTRVPSGDQLPLTASLVISTRPLPFGLIAYSEPLP